MFPLLVDCVCEKTIFSSDGVASFARVYANALLFLFLALLITGALQGNGEIKVLYTIPPIIPEMHKAT